MAKKRKCRYSETELNIHEQAVKLRKMTDVQLVAAFNEAKVVATAPSVAQAAPEAQPPKNDTSGVEKLLSALSEGKCKGVGGATCYKIMEFAQSMGLMA